MATRKSSTSSSGAKSGAKKSTSKPKSTTTKGRAKSNAKKQDSSLWASIALFAVGLLLIVMVFVQGEHAWAHLREFLFGLFGASFYFLGVLLIYIAVCVAQKRSLTSAILKTLFGMFSLSGTAILFSKFSLEGLNFAKAFIAFYENGKESVFGGGIFGAVFGGTLLALTGRPAANIIVIIFFICAIMVLTGITPAEIFDFCAEHFGKAKDKSKAVSEAYAEKAEQRAQDRELRRAEYEQQRQNELAQGEQIPTERQTKRWFGIFGKQIENIDAPTESELHSQTDSQGWEQLLKMPHSAQNADPRASFDIDLGPDVNAIKSAMNSETKDGSKPLETVEIGPGGTFGQEAINDAMKQIQKLDEEQKVTAQTISTDFFAPASAEIEKPLVEDDDGWISMKDEPEEQATPQAEKPTLQKVEENEFDCGDDIENLVVAAMDKPHQAEQEVAELAQTLQNIPREYNAPPISLFEMPVDVQDFGVERELKANAQKLVDTLESFGVKTRVLDISRGPSVTRYELQPLAGVKISRITNLADDIALNLAVGGVRIEAPIPGKPAVGIEVPNRKSTPVAIRGLFESSNFKSVTSPLSFVLGKDIAGVPQVADLCKMPHLLVAGSTGSGKSVCVNSIIMSFLYRSSPEDIKLILIDPKVVELAEYNGIPHLLMPVVTEARKAAGALASATVEMERRYRLFADNNAKEIKSFNKLAEENPMLEKLPYIAIVIDELADLMMVAGKEVEEYICRIAQKARAAGMHLIVATQRPSVDVITGLIKTNIPSRISFAVSSQVDSRTILDGAGAEKLLGMGDMLFMPLGASKPTRIQGTYIKDGEINRALEFIKAGGGAVYDETMIAEMEKVAANPKQTGKNSGGDGAKSDGNFDPMLKQCAEVVIDAGQASTSLLQRRCKLGYARAARIMDELEELRIVGPYEGAKPRAVLVSRQQWLEMSLNETAPTEG